MAPRAARGRRLRVRAAGRRGGAAQPGGAAARALRRARAVASSATWTPCSPTPAEWSVDPWSRRAARRLRVGPRRARHEEPGGGGGWRPRSRSSRRAGARESGELLLVFIGRRGGRRRCTAPSGCARAHPDKVRCDFMRQRGRRRGVRVRRPPLLRRRAWPRRACSASRSPRSGRAGHASIPRIGDNALVKLAPAARPAWPQAAMPLELTPEPRGAPARRSACSTAAIRRAPCARSRRATRGWRCWSSRCSASRSRRRWRARREKINVIPSRARAPASTAACRRGSARTHARERIEEALGTATATTSASSRTSRWSATAPRSTRR